MRLAQVEYALLIAAVLVFPRTHNIREKMPMNPQQNQQTSTSSTRAVIDRFNDAL